MLVANIRSEPLSPPISLSEHPAPTPLREVPVLHTAPPTPHFNFALEGRSIALQRRAQQGQSSGQQTARDLEGKTFSPLHLQLKIDLHSEQGVDVPSRAPGQSRQAKKLRAQIRRRQEQQKPTEEIVYQRRTPSRPKTPAYRQPLSMSTMSMPVAGQKFNVADDALVFNTAEEASAVVKRLLAKSSSIAEEHHVVATSSSSKKVSHHQVSESPLLGEQDYLQDSFDFLHQRHTKNLADVIAQHQRQQQAVAHSEQPQEQMTRQQQTVKQRKQVHIHQSSFYDDQVHNGHILTDANDENNTSKTSPAQTFKSIKKINLSNNNSNSSVMSDAEESKQRRCVRESSTSSAQSSDCSDNCNNNFCDSALSVKNKSNKRTEVIKSSSKSSSSTSSVSSSSSSSSKVQHQQVSSKRQVMKQSFSSSSQDFDDRVGIDVLLTPSSPTTRMIPSKGSSGSSLSSSSSDPLVECKQSVKSFTSKTVKKTVSDGKTKKTDVEKFAETAEEQAEGSPDKPVITFSHVTSEGSHQTFQDDIVRFDSSALSSPSRSRSPSPLLEMPAPYADLSKEIMRPPIESSPAQ